MNDYFIKKGYQHRTVNATIEQQPGDYWQGHRTLLSRHAQASVYREAKKLIRQHNLKTVLDVGCGLAHKLMQYIAPIAQTTGVDQPSTVDAAKKNSPNRSFYSGQFRTTHTTAKHL